MKQSNGNRVIFPEKYAGFVTDISNLKDFLWTLPSEKSINDNRNLAPVMSIPMPDGSVARFRVWESNVMEPGLAEKLPDMRQFLGQGIDDPYASIRFDYNPYTGFHAQILSSHFGRIYIDPYANGDLNYYMSYNTKDYHRDVQFICGVVDADGSGLASRTEQTQAACLGTSLRTYRLAVACTGEYSVAVAGSTPTIPAVAAAILTSVNRVTGVYEKEVSLRMILIANNIDIIYLDGNSDPYTNNNGSTMLGQNQANIDGVIGTANYDIGHVFSTGGGGVANLNSPCNGGSKARGVTGLSSPVGDSYDIDYVAHEMGHQWGGNHSMAGCGSSPNSTKYEVGSGTTIQAYAGICGSENIQGNSDPYFHAISFDEISNFITTGGGNSCGVSTPTGNTLPVINPLPNNGLTIPISTPFTLSGTATDANGDPLTYNWEQWDFQGAQTWNAGVSAPAGNTVPLFKSRIPKTTGSRTFPDIAVILAGYPANPPATMNGLKGETLSPVARPMNFRLTVRDNRAGGGGIVSSGGAGCQTNTTFLVNVAGTTPFAVTSPNGGEVYDLGSTQTITWNNAGTTTAPFNVANVSISISTDGGISYPVVILASTPNDGSEAVTIPGPATLTARIKIEAIGNIFFDISNANFTVALPPNSFDFNTPAPVVSPCPAAASLSATLATIQNGTFSIPIVLTSSTPPAGTTVSFSPNPVNPGSSTVVTLSNTNTLNPGSYTITVTGTAGAIVKTRVITYTINGGSGPAITAQPANQAVCTGGSTSFSITAATATSYQWQLSIDGGNTFTNISNGGIYSNVTTNTLTITGVTAAINNYRYRSNAFVPCGSSASNAAILTITPPPAITAQPADATICAASNNTFTVAGTGGSLTYQWQVSSDGGGTFNNVSNGGVYSGATSASLTITGATAAMNSYRYRAILTGTCSPTATSNAAILTVISPAIVTTQPVASALCSGGNTSFTVAGTSSQAIIYQWQVSTDGGTTFTNISNVSGYSGTTTPTLTITGATATFNNYRYRALLSNATCATATPSNVALLTVRQLPTVSLAASPLTNLLPGQVTTLTATPSPSTGGTVNITWLYNGTSPTPAITGNTYVANVERLGTYQVLISETFTSPTLVCSNQSSVVTIDASASSKLFIFPSPNDGRFTVSYFNSAGTSTKRKIAIFDSKGALVYNREFAIAGPYTLLNINMERASRGIYYVVVGDANGSKLADGRVHVR
ncbi:MAG: M12 family metallo-peptidase [Bacteroidota bacterium]|nr:M12 family metallo-peptidase [Bacteroidota bacterium]